MSKRNVILLHVTFWILFALVPELPLIFPDRDYPAYFYYNTASSQLLNLLNFYLVYFLISIDFLNPRKILTNLLKVLGAILAFVVVRLIVMVIVDIYLSGFDYQEIHIRFYHITLETYFSICFTILALLIKFMIDWFNAQKQKSELLAKTKTAELALLRSQINPHFLFNTLNNLYSLVYKKSDEAPSMVMKLSDIMRYMLHDSNSEKVALEKEIDYLKSFIDLNEIRLKKERFVSFTVNGETTGKLIPPMLLVPFVENAFKHGRKKYRIPGIQILIETDRQRLDFDIRNYLAADGLMQKDLHGGIGLDNVRKRLNLIYPGCHELTIERSNDEFHVHLTLDKI